MNFYSKSFLFDQGIELSVLALILTMMLCGCGGADLPTPVNVSGTVSYDQQPLKEGTIILVPEGANTGRKISAQIREGQFQFGGQTAPIPGKYKVKINATNNDVAPMDSEEALAELHAQRAAGKRPKLKVVKIPIWYNKNSTLELMVAENMSAPSFDLSSKKPSR